MTKLLLVALLAIGQQFPDDRNFEPGVVQIAANNSRSTGVIVASELVLTSNHGTASGNVSADGRSGTVIAADTTYDLALVRVPGLYGPVRQVADYGDEDTGQATLYGYPGGKFLVSSGTVASNGDLSFTVFAGGSGGPLIKNNRVIGILTRFHGVATASQIRSFLSSKNYAHVFQRQREQIAQRAPQPPPVPDPIAQRMRYAPPPPPEPERRDALREVDDLCWEIAQELRRLRESGAFSQRRVYVVRCPRFFDDED